MGHPFRLFLLAVAVSSTGCFADGLTEGMGSGETGSTSDASGEAGAATTSTGASTTSEDSSGESTSGPEEGGPDSDESSGSGDGGEPGCWESDITEWDVEAFDTTNLNGDTPAGMAMDADGLQLVYTSMVEGRPTVSVAARRDRDEPWVGGVAAGDWGADAVDTFNVRFATRTRLTLTRDGVINTSRFTMGTWWPPVPVGFDEAPTELTGAPGFFEMRLGMLLEVQDGEPVASGATYRAYEARRDSTNESFGPLSLVEFPEWTEENPVLCMVPTSDGRHVFFGGGFPIRWGDPDDVTASALDVWHAERTADGTWDAPTEIDVVSHDAVETCPTSVTDDGCTMIVHHFEVGSGTVAYAVATRV